MPIPTITTTFDPPILATDTDEAFSDKVDQMFGTDLPAFVTELEAHAAAVVAAAADTGPVATSTTSVAIGTGTKAFPDVGSGKTFMPGQWVTIADASAPTTNLMVGQVSIYSFADGGMTVEVPATGHVTGSGTISSWVIGLSGPQGPTGSLGVALGGNGGKVIGINAAGDDLEAVDLGWEQIATASPAAAASQAFTSLGSTVYSDLLVRYSLTRSASAIINMYISPNGSSYSSARQLSATSAGSAKGTIRFPDFNEDWGVMIPADIDGATYSSPAFAASQIPAPWIVTGGIDAIQFIPSAGTFSGTITIYGRR